MTQLVISDFPRRIRDFASQTSTGWKVSFRRPRGASTQDEKAWLRAHGFQSRGSVWYLEERPLPPWPRWGAAVELTGKTDEDAIQALHDLDASEAQE